MIQTAKATMSHSKSVLFLLNGTPSERYRILNHIRWIQRHIDADIHFGMIAFRKSNSLPLQVLFTWLFYIRLILQAGYYDRVVIQKRLLPIPILRLVLRQNADVVFDFDDAIYAKPQWKKQKPVMSEKFVYCVRHVALVIAGNAYLAGRVRMIAPQARVVVIPTPIDTERFDGVQPDKNGCKPVVIGWLGLSSNLYYFRELQEILRALGEKYGDRIIFKMVSDQFEPIKGVPTIEKTWSETEEPRDIASFDIGLMPLTDDEWSRGKCGWKALMYMAMGVPCVISPVGVNAHIIRDRVEGFFAETPEEWFRAVSALVEDRALRQAMGEAGKTTIARHYSLQKHARHFYELIFLGQYPLR